MDCRDSVPPKGLLRLTIVRTPLFPYRPSAFFTLRRKSRTSSGAFSGSFERKRFLPSNQPVGSSYTKWYSTNNAPGTLTSGVAFR